MPIHVCLCVCVCLNTGLRRYQSHADRQTPCTTGQQLLTHAQTHTHTHTLTHTAPHKGKRGEKEGKIENVIRFDEKKRRGEERKGEKGRGHQEEGTGKGQDKMLR